MILLLLGCFLAFSAWSALQARTKGSRITDADYYSKGLKYNQTMVEKKAASVLGWKLEPSLDERLFSVMLDDGKQPVTSANGSLFLYHNDDRKPQLYQLKEENPGYYTLHLPDKLNGEFRVQVEFERQGARLSRQLLLNL